MDFSANSCPLPIDNTLAPGTELLCWNTGAFRQLIIDITDIDAAEYNLVGHPGAEVIDPPGLITLDGKYVIDVTEYNRVCLEMVTAGIGTANIEAYLTENFSGVLVLGCLTFALFNGTPNNIELVLATLPFNLFNGNSNNIPVVPC
jgi:hypothetical protein